MSSGTIDGAGERQTCKLCFDDIDILVQYLENTRVWCRTQDGTLPDSEQIFERKDLQW